MLRFSFIMFVILISNLSFCQENRFTYLGEKGERIIEKTSMNPSTMYSNFYIDSSSQELYTGIVIKRHELVKDPIDSMCVINGVVDGYHKEYMEINRGLKYPSKLVFVNQDKRFEVNVNNNLADSSQSRTYLNLFVGNIFYAYKTDFKKRRIKLERVRRDDNLEKLKLEKDRFRFKCLKELEAYFKSEAEKGIISDEILEKCRRLGFFSNEPIEEPIILGNCNKKE